MATRYIIEGRPDTPAAGLPLRMLKVQNRTRAMAHVASSWFTARVADGDDIEKAATAGIKTETVGDAQATSEGDAS